MHNIGIQWEQLRACYNAYKRERWKNDTYSQVIQNFDSQCTNWIEEAGWSPHCFKPISTEWGWPVTQEIMWHEFPSHTNQVKPLNPEINVIHKQAGHQLHICHSPDIPFMYEWQATHTYIKGCTCIKGIPEQSEWHSRHLTSWSQSDPLLKIGWTSIRRRGELV